MKASKSKPCVLAKYASAVTFAPLDAVTDVELKL
jgi:hypothetical protein